MAFCGIWAIALICAWLTLAARSPPTWVLITVVAMLFDFTSKGIWCDPALDIQDFGNIGLSGLAP